MGAPPFSGSNGFTLQAELHFIDTIGCWSTKKVKPGVDAALRGYIASLPHRHWSFTFPPQPMTAGTKQMLADRAREQLDRVVRSKA
jgi:hypothetical protein